MKALKPKLDILARIRERDAVKAHRAMAQKLVDVRRGMACAGALVTLDVTEFCRINDPVVRSALYMEGWHEIKLGDKWLPVVEDGGRWFVYQHELEAVVGHAVKVGAPIESVVH